MKEYNRLEVPSVWKSLLNGNKYNNHGYGGVKDGKMDLPKEEYPFTIIYVNNKITFAFTDSN